jgi:uncharacterized protein with PQ loop repeat
MTFLAFLASVSGIVLGFSGLFQVQRIYKTKSAKDIAPVTYWIAIVGSVIWIFYGIELVSYPLIFSNLLGFVVASLILRGCYLYGKKRTKKNGAWGHRLWFF